MKKILIIENEETLLDLLYKKISKDYTVAILRDSSEIMDKIKEINPDLIILELNMPDKDGFEIINDINAENIFKHIPIIVISNTGQPAEIDRAIQMGAKDYFIKTQFNPSEVITKIDKQIDNIKNN